LFRTAIEHPRATSAQRGEIEWRLGVAYARSERWAVAASTLERSIQRRSATADDWCFLASTRLQSGDLTGAQTDLERATRLDPECTAARRVEKELELAASTDSPDRKVIPVGHEQVP
jgi:hypothetical protein